MKLRVMTWYGMGNEKQYFQEYFPRMGNLGQEKHWLAKKIFLVYIEYLEIRRLQIFNT